MLGIAVKPGIGIGDGIQFSSVPENYYHATGNKLFDASKCWFFDHNPYVVREPTEPVEKVVQMWNFSPKQWDWPIPRTHGVYLHNAEIFAHVMGVKETKLNRPRLYRYENYDFDDRRMILLQTEGKSHGEMPEHVIEHILKKYKKTGCLYQIGLPTMRDIGIPRLQTPTLWGLCEVISKARMLICMDSGPAWIGACYPDVVCKKLRTKPSSDALRDWVPLAIDNVHSHWDSREHMIYNASEHDIGFTWSYRRI